MYYLISNHSLITHSRAHALLPCPVVTWPLSVSAPTELSPDSISPAAPASLCPSSSPQSEAEVTDERQKAQTSEYRQYQRFRFDSRSFGHLRKTSPASLDPSQPHRTQPGGAGAPLAPSSAPPSGQQVPVHHWQTKWLLPLFLFLSRAGQRKKVMTWMTQPVSH